MDMYKEKFQLTKEVEMAISLLEHRGFECFVVGGCVRDLCRNVSPHDYDLTTNALVEQMLDVFYEYQIIDTGSKHGTLTVIINHHPLEITTYRTDLRYDNHRTPQVEFSLSLQQDLMRRDFTINALAYNPSTGIIDYHHGLRDINNKWIRCVGDASIRFEEDALRILRGLRFASQLGFKIETQTKQAMFHQKELLHFLSYERIVKEIKGLLIGENAQNVIQEYFAILNCVIAEFDENTDIAYLPFDSTIRLAKIMLRSSNFEQNLAKYKLSNEEVRRIVNVHQYQDLNLTLDKVVIKKALNLMGFSSLKDILLINQLDQRIITIAQQIIADNECYNLSQLAINGNDLKKLGYQGKDIGQMLTKVLELVIEEKLDNDYKMIIKFLKGME